MNQHELAFQDLEISYESGFCKILADYVGIKSLAGTTHWTCLLYQNLRTTFCEAINVNAQKLGRKWKEHMYCCVCLSNIINYR